MSQQSTSSMTKACATCGAETEKGHRFCPACGVAVAGTRGRAQHQSLGLGSAGTNGFAIASMVLGILWMSWIGSILALAFGYTAIRQIRRTGEDGRGMALAGVILGWVGVAFLLVVLVLLVASATHGPSPVVG